MQKSVLLAAERIKRLEVQGARNVAITAIKAIEEGAKESKAKRKKEFLEELSMTKDILFASRETEPFMRNAIRYIIYAVEISDKEKVNALVDLISSVSKQFLENLQRSQQEIADIGSRRIRSSSKVLTHCHSSTVTHMLKKAKEEGKSFEVICTESRPLFQGRITVKEMLDAGIKATLIVDSAARFVMNEVDIVVVGADAITSEGNVINKIGTSMIALAANEARTPFYVVTELLKFDPLTIHGDYEKIEERNPGEIWEEPPQGLTIRNPSFDITRRDFIHGIICEEGILSPHSIIEVARRRYPWILGV